MALADKDKYVRWPIYTKDGQDTGDYMEVPYLLLVRAAAAAKLPQDSYSYTSRTIPEKHGHPTPEQASWYKMPPFKPDSPDVTDEQRTAWVTACAKCQAGDTVWTPPPPPPPEPPVAVVH